MSVETVLNLWLNSRYNFNNLPLQLRELDKEFQGLVQKQQAVEKAIGNITMQQVKN